MSLCLSNWSQHDGLLCSFVYFFFIVCFVLAFLWSTFVPRSSVMVLVDSYGCCENNHLVAYHMWCRCHCCKILLNRRWTCRLYLWILVKDILRSCITLAYHLGLPSTCSGFGGSTDLLLSILARFLSVFLILSWVQCVILSSGFYYYAIIFWDQSSMYFLLLWNSELDSICPFNCWYLSLQLRSTPMLYSRVGK